MAEPVKIEVPIPCPSGMEIDSEKSVLTDGVFTVVFKEKAREVRTWEDIPALSGYYIDDDSTIMKESREAQDRLSACDARIALTAKHCKKMLAIAQISQLMPYYGGAITDAEWQKNCVKFVIERDAGALLCPERISRCSFLAFHTREQRSCFFKHNLSLVKDYFMMD